MLLASVSLSRDLRSVSSVGAHERNDEGEGDLWPVGAVPAHLNFVFDRSMYFICFENGSKEGEMRRK